MICLPMEHLGTLKPSLKRPCVPDQTGIWKCWFSRRGETLSARRKTTRSTGENQQQTQPRSPFFIEKSK